MKKALIEITIALFFIIIVILISTSFGQNSNLRSLEKEVSNIALPTNIEKIAIKSGIGDSGGNGDQSTLRVVLVVKTNLNIEELKETIKNMDLHFSKHYMNRDNTPIFYVRHCEGGRFHSQRNFVLHFDELNPVTDYSNYYFIEFIE